MAGRWFESVADAERRGAAEAAEVGVHGDRRGQ